MKVLTALCERSSIRSSLSAPRRHLPIRWSSRLEHNSSQAMRHIISSRVRILLLSYLTCVLCCSSFNFNSLNFQLCDHNYGPLLFFAFLAHQLYFGHPYLQKIYSSRNFLIDASYHVVAFNFCFHSLRALIRNSAYITVSCLGCCRFK